MSAHSPGERSSSGCRQGWSDSTAALCSGAYAVINIELGLIHNVMLDQHFVAFCHIVSPSVVINIKSDSQCDA